MGLESASFCCYFDNKAYLIRSYHGIIIVEGWKVLSFDAWSCHGITKFFFFFLRVVILEKEHLFYC
jgi:hypothetical protein